MDSPSHVLFVDIKMPTADIRTKPYHRDRILRRVSLVKVDLSELHQGNP